MHKLLKFFIIAWFIVILAYRLMISYSYRPELTNGESNNIWKAINVAAGKKIYNDPEKLPIEVFQYNPLSELPIIGFSKLFNPQSQYYLYNITVAGRLFQLFCTLVLAYFIYKIGIKLLEISKKSSLMASLAAITMLTPTAFTIRPDATVLIFLFSSIYAFGLFIKSNSKKWIILTSLLIILSFLTKQDGIFIAFPFGLYLLMNKKWNPFLFFSLSILLFLITTLFSLHLFFGELYWINTFKGLKNTMSIHQMIAVFDRSNSFFGFYLIIGLILSIYNLLRGHKLLQLLSIINLFYLFISLGISTKIGSWVNYYTPNVIITVILIFGTVFSNNYKKSREFQIITYVYIIFSAFIYLTLQAYNYTLPFIKNYKNQYISSYKEYQYLANKFPISKNEFIFTPTPLLRNFYALNNCMVNTEYYNQASYRYEHFKNNTKTKLKYIIFEKDEISLVNNIVSFFSINLKNYEIEEHNSYLIYKRKTLK